MNFGRKLAFYSVGIVAAIGLIVLAVNPFAKKFTTESFRPFENFRNTDSALVIDLSGAVNNGIVIPNVKQLPGGKFVFSFRVKNNKLGSRNLSYKIYYQNETYKQPEFREANGFRYERTEAGENFYGSWEDTDIEFKPIPEIGWYGSATVTDSFRIVGNPRNERKYFGQDNRHGVSAADIASMIASIRQDPAWVSNIELKAKNNSITINEQLYRDALYSLNEQQQQGDVNNRWKRNPRMGSYRFMLVVTATDHVESIPVSVRNIAQTEPDGHNINPFYYFLYGPGAHDENVEVNVAGEELKVKAEFDPGSGIYVNPFEFSDNSIDTINYCKTCGTDSTLFAQAQFAQFFHSIDKNVVMPMVPVTGDVVDGHMTQTQYEELSKRFSKEQRINDRFWITNKPCATVKSDPLTDEITIFNPGNDSLPYKKEHVGVKTRIGMTYGKFRVCVQFPEMISEENVWNGLVNAVWLLYQDNAAWNARSICEGGYIPKDDMRGQYADRKNIQNYSEIDFEIVKSSRNWPKESYAAVPQPEVYDAAASRDIVVACTNWDLACMQPEKHVKGVMPLVVQNRRFDLHRWDSWYQAVTIRTPVNHDEIYKRNYYWFEIEWTPDFIAWRIGPEKDRLSLVGYMDKTVTTIPDNQMIVVVTQEFHDSEWWKPAPFNQRNIPYPKNPMVGKVLAVEVE
jgi:hypothetical protein